MDQYHKIQTVFNRDPANNYKTLLVGEYSKPEFMFLADCTWVFTEKVDGTNIRVIIEPEGVHGSPAIIKVRGKTDNAHLPADLTQNILNLFAPNLQRIHESHPQGICFYGEGYGPGIQKGGKYRPDKSFVVFDIKIGEFWMNRRDLESVTLSYDLDCVPVIGRGTLPEMALACKEGFFSVWGDFQAEGIIARPPVELTNQFGERIITKLKCSDFSKDDLKKAILSQGYRGAP